MEVDRPYSSPNTHKSLRMLLVWELEVVSFSWHMGLCGRLVEQSGVERQGSSPEVLSVIL